METEEVVIEGPGVVMLTASITRVECDEEECSCKTCRKNRKKVV